MRRPILFLPLLALIAACNSGAAGEAVPLTAEEVALTQYLADARLNNGAYDWSIAPDATLDKSRSGLRSITGIAALGLLDAHERDIERAVPELPAGLTATKNYIYGQLTRFATDENTTLSVTNLMFMARYKELFGLSTQEWDMTLACLQKRLEELNDSHGTTDTVRVDGWVNQTVELRTSQGLESLIGWDVAFILRALSVLDAAQEEIDYLTAQLLLVNYDATATYGPLSAAHALLALETVGDTTRREELVQVILSVMDESGRVGNDTQLSAYALMALRAAGREEAELIAEHLRSQVTESGSILESDGNIYFEVVGEVISALLR